MRVKALFFHAVALSAFPGINAQSAQCVTVADGCDSGSSNEAGVVSAIARFQDGMIYGGSDSIVMSSALNGGALAMLTYLCNDGSTPPKLEGSIIRSSFQKILSCPNRCGGVASSGNSNCGFGVLIANNAANADCFSKAVNVVPTGTAPQIVPSVGAFRNPVCLFDSPGARVLTDGSSVDFTGMTVEKCIALAAADGWRYAGVEFGGECYWGDIKTNPEQSNQDNCNTPCAGNPNQVCGGGNRILVYENSNSNDVYLASLSVNNYHNDPTNSALAGIAKDAIDNALNHALSFFDQIFNSFVKAAQQQLIQDLTAAASTAAEAVAAASASIAAVLAAEIAAALASAQAVEDAKNQQPTPTGTITRPPTSTAEATSTSSSSSSTSSACPLCVSCADDLLPETAPDDSLRKRQNEEELTRPSKLYKRDVKTFSICSTTYTSGPYPPGNANNQFDAYGYTYRATTSQCTWNFGTLFWDASTPVGVPPATKGGSYQTEHVYESNVVKQFAQYIITSDGGTCRAAGPFMYMLARTTAFPGRPSNAFGVGGSALQQMMLNLPSTTNGGLVALDEELNNLKAKVFDGAVAFGVYNRGVDNLVKMTRFATLWAYLSDPQIIDIFQDTSLRMRATLQTLDDEIAQSILPNPGYTWVGLYNNWESNFLLTRAGVVNANMVALKNQAVNLISNDNSIGSQQLRNTFVANINALTAAGADADPFKWLDLIDLAPGGV